MSGVRVLVGTKKGAFVLTSDAKREKWDVSGPFFGGPGLVLRFASPAAPGTVVANCLTGPSSMALDAKTNTLYVAELGGSLVAVRLVP